MKHYLFTSQNPLQFHLQRDHPPLDQHTIPIDLHLDLVDLRNFSILPNIPILNHRSRRPACINRNLRKDYIFRNMDKMGTIINTM